MSFAADPGQMLPTDRESRDSFPKDAETVPQSLTSLELDRFVIADRYVRFDERARSALKGLRQRVTESLLGKRREPVNFLL